MGEDIKKLEIILKAEDLQDFIFRITSKEPKKPKQSGEDVMSKPGNNGIPAKYRYSIGTRMQNYTIDLIEALEDARYEKSNRVKHLNEALRILRHINNTLWLCFRNNIVSGASAEACEKLITDVKYMALAWRNKSQS